MKEEIEFLAIDISGNCNLDCSICSLPGHFPKKEPMSLATVERLENVFQNDSLRKIALQCNCEPLINRDIIHILKYIKTTNRNLVVSFVTNGVLLKKETIELLLKYNIDEISISIDGANKKSYEKIRRGANFDNVTENIRELVRQRNLENVSTKIGIVAVGLKQNVNELSAILDLVKNLGVDHLSVNGLEPYTEEMAKQILYGKDIDTKHENIFADLKQKAKKYSVGLFLPSLIMVPSEFCNQEGCVISANGDVHPCHVLSYERPFYYLGKKCKHEKITFGNINHADFYKIWRSKRYMQFRASLRVGRFPSVCDNCLIRQNVIVPGHSENFEDKFIGMAAHNKNFRNMLEDMRAHSKNLEEKVLDLTCHNNNLEKMLEDITAHSKNLEEKLLDLTRHNSNQEKMLLDSKKVIEDKKEQIGSLTFYARNNEEILRGFFNSRTYKIASRIDSIRRSILGNKINSPNRIKLPMVMDFSEEYPASLFIKGFSNKEKWGRWSNSKTAIVEFGGLLPSEFELMLAARAFGPNVGRPVEIRIGEVSKEIALSGDTKDYSVKFTNVNHAQALTFLVPNPTSPKELGYSSDSRTLGIGIVTLSILSL